MRASVGLTLKSSPNPKGQPPREETLSSQSLSSARALSNSQSDAPQRDELRNVEARRLSDDLLINERRLYETALSNTPDFVYIFDLSHRFIYANRSLLSVWNRTWEEAIGKNCLELGYEPWHAEMHDREIEEVIRTKSSIRGEVPFSGSNGKRIYDYIFAPAFGADGEVIAIAGTTRDITDRKEADDARQKSDERRRIALEALLNAQKHTEQQKRMYETVLDNTADFNYVFDLDGRFAYTNRALADLLQKPWDEVVGKDFFDLGYPPDLAERLQRQIQQVISTKQSVRDETPYTSAAGTRAYEYIFRPVLGADGKVEAVAGSTRDVTEFKETNRRKDEFLAMLAHELRNPLAPISNSIHIMKSSSVSDKIRDEAAMLVDRQIVQMTHLLNDLLDVSRVTLGKIELRLEKTSLSNVINMAVESIRPLIESREQTLSINIPDGTIWLNADETRMTQIFSNLLNNAAKYTQKKGHIQIAVTTNAAVVTVKISDNGIGIPKGMQSHIFDLFSQVDSSLERAQGGLGIGLTIVKSLIEMHKGSVTVESEGQDKGSVFTASLPQAASQKDDPSVAPVRINDNLTKDARRVLIVDDNEASAKTLGWTLEMLGHDIRLAHDGSKAIEIAESYKPQVILLDIGLPGTNGYEICEILRKRPLFKNCIIIAQTGWGQKEHVERSKAAGFDYHLVKPIRMEKLQEIFQEMALSGK